MIKSSNSSISCTRCGTCTTGPCDKPDCELLPLVGTQVPLGCTCGLPRTPGVMHRSEGPCYVAYASAPVDIGSANERRLRAMLYRLSTSEGAEYGEIEREIIAHVAILAASPAPVTASQPVEAVPDEEFLSWLYMQNPASDMWADLMPRFHDLGKGDLERAIEPFITSIAKKYRECTATPTEAPASQTMLQVGVSHNRIGGTFVIHLVQGDHTTVLRAQDFPANRDSTISVPLPISAPASQPEGYGLNPEQLQRLRESGLKPEEIAGDAAVQHERVGELLHWFARFALGQANPKWAVPHAYELAYFIATNGPNRHIDLEQVRKAAFKEGVNITPEKRGTLERIGFATPISAPASGGEALSDEQIIERMVASGYEREGGQLVLYVEGGADVLVEEIDAIKIVRAATKSGSVTAPAAEVAGHLSAEGWSIKREGGTIVIEHPSIGRTVTHKYVSDPADVVLHHLADSLLSIPATEPVKAEECHHDDTHREGAIWEVCDQCGRRWADDEGGRPVKAEAAQAGSVERFSIYEDHGRANMMGDDDGKYMLYSHYAEGIEAARQQGLELAAQHFELSEFDQAKTAFIVSEIRALKAATQPASGGVAEDALLALLPGTYYMDPPDGGSVTVIEQLQRMAEDAARYRWLRDDAGDAGGHIAPHAAILTEDGAFKDLIDGPELDIAIAAARAALNQKGGA